MHIRVEDFRESDHSANISIYFNLRLDNGISGMYSLDIQNSHNNILSDLPVYLQQNSTYPIASNHSITDWLFSNTTRIHAFGAVEFYPYDSWLFNLTIYTPLFPPSRLAAEFDTAPLPGWIAQCLPSTSSCFTISANTVVVSFVVNRADWQSLPVRALPLVLLFVLSVSMIEMPRAVTDKVTIITSVIVFVALFLFNLSGNLPPRTFASTYAESLLFDILLIASVLLVEAIIEARVNLIYELRQTDFFVRGCIRTSIQLLTMSLIVVIILWPHYFAYQGYLNEFNWVNIPIADSLLCFIIPFIGIIVDLLLLWFGRDALRGRYE